MGITGIACMIGRVRLGGAAGADGADGGCDPCSTEICRGISCDAGNEPGMNEGQSQSRPVATVRR